MRNGTSTRDAFEQWLSTPAGRYADSRERFLIRTLLKPAYGERLLHVTSYTEHHLAQFKREGCHVTGLAESRRELDRIRDRLGDRGEVQRGSCTDIPFSDNEFDIVSLVLCLEFTDDPRKALREAIRVCSKRLFVGIYNKYSLLNPHARLNDAYGAAFSNDARFTGILGIRSLLREVIPTAAVHWGSVVFLPMTQYASLQSLDSAIPVMNNPFGSFLGIVADVEYTHMTLQDPLADPLKLSLKDNSRVPGAMKESRE